MCPIIEINNEDLKNLSEYLNQRFRNKSMLCKKCGYLDDKIITNYETCSETIIKVENPNVLFLFYELGKEGDDFSNVLNNIRNNINLIKY